VNPAASAQPQPEDAPPEDAQPENATPDADAEPANGEPVEDEDDEYEPLWQGFGGTVPRHRGPSKEIG
jgi:hypothetical protein